VTEFEISSLQKVAFLELEEALSRVHSDAERWQDVCDAVSRCFGAVGTIIIPVDPEHRGVWLTQSPCLKATTEHYISEGWHLNDFRQNGAKLLLKDGIFTDDDLADRSVFLELPYYRDFLIPRGLGYAAVLHIEVDGRDFAMSIQFSHQRQPLTTLERKFALAVASRIMDAVGILSAAVKRKISEFTELMSETVDEVAVFDAAGNIQSERTQEAQLVCWPTKEIGLACAVDPDNFHPIFATREDDLCSYDFTLLLIPPSLRHFFVEEKVLVMKSEASSTFEGERFGAMFDLTRAELRCVKLLSNGMSLQEIAAELGLKVSTVRQRLKVVFQKTGAHSQGKLVALFFRA
jgi:DNA-binding CsgD family transcriptional regulator